MKNFYKILKWNQEKNNHIKKSFARLGVIQTTNGTIDTPAFIPVATKATLRGIIPELIYKYIGAKALFANSYHLYLQPGLKVINKMGGINKFMNWPHPIFTDSGGFQILSMNSKKKILLKFDQENTNFVKHTKPLVSINKNSVTFKSHINGKKYTITPEDSIDIQHTIGADIIFAFDELTSLSDTKHYQLISLNRTYEWAKRCLSRHQELSKNVPKYNQFLFGVIQGAQYKPLRQKASHDFSVMDFDGYGIGGALEKNNLCKIIRWCTDILPIKKPKHLLGIGDPISIIQAIDCGIDTFDCVSPARLARHGSAYTRNGRINLKKTLYKHDSKSVCQKCKCYTCLNYSRSYLHHLIKSQEMLFAILLTIHNEYYIVHLVDNVRNALKNNYFEDFKCDFIQRYDFSKTIF